eukprot:gene4971-8565_t
MSPRPVVGGIPCSSAVLNSQAVQPTRATCRALCPDKNSCSIHSFPVTEEISKKLLKVCDSTVEECNCFDALQKLGIIKEKKLRKHLRQDLYQCKKARKSFRTLSINQATDETTVVVEEYSFE